MSESQQPPPPQDDKFHQGDDEIRDFFGKVKHGWTKWGEIIMWTVVAGCAIYLGVNWYNRRSNDKSEEARQLLVSDSAAVLLGVAKEGGRKQVPVQAALRAGDLYLNEALKTEGAERTKALAGADEAYQLAVKLGGAGDMFQANATLGLASVAETRGEWDAAAKAYDTVIAWKERHPHLAALASAGKERLAALKAPVVWGAEPKERPTLNELGQPQEPAAPGDGGLIGPVGNGIAPEAPKPSDQPAETPADGQPIGPVGGAEPAAPEATPAPAGEPEPLVK